MPSITWHAVDLMTGNRGPQVTTQQQGTVGRIIGEPTDVSGLPVACEIDGEPVPGWESATLPGRMMLLAVDESDEPVWGGMILRRRADHGPWVQLDMATLEAYFDRRYVTDHGFLATDQGAIVTGILNADVMPTGVQFVLDAVSRTVRDRIYYDDEDKTALSALQELMGLEGGPEFTIDLEWADVDHTVLNRVMRVRDRLGSASSSPVSRFEYPGSVVSFEYIEDFSSDKGANDVMAISSGEGSVRPESQHMVAQDLLDNGWARFERRYTPTTSITSFIELDAHARGELSHVRDGLAELTLEADLEWAPRVNVDFRLGDDVTVALTAPRFPARMGPNGDMVAGYSKTVRCVGWEIDFDGGVVRPRLLEVG